MATGTIKNTKYSDMTALNGSATYNVEITSYNTVNNQYEAPCDGYILAQASGGVGTMSLYGAFLTMNIPNSQWGVMFVKKGGKAYCYEHIGRAFFRAFW